MMAQPNLIRRPILVRGVAGHLRLRQGGLREARDEHARRHVGLELSRRPGHVERRVLPRQGRPRPRGFDELEFYARWFDVVEVNSTFYGQPRARGHREVGRAHARRASSSRSSCTRSSPTRRCSGRPRPTPRRSAGRGLARRDRRRASGRRRRVQGRHRAAGGRRQARRRCWCSSRRASRRRPRRSTTSAGCCARSATYPLAVELRHGRGATRARRRRRCSPPTARRGCSSTSRSSSSRSGSSGTRRQRQQSIGGRRGAGLHAVPRPQCRRVVAARRGRGSLQLPLLGARSWRRSPSRGGWRPARR